MSRCGTKYLTVMIRCLDSKKKKKAGTYSEKYVVGFFFCYSNIIQ